MNLTRIFSGSAWKGTKRYVKTQRIYEILRTLLLFSVSAALFLGGLFSTGTRLNLLTVVAVLGILPASKSMVSAIMFCLHSGLSDESASKIEAHEGTLHCLYDLVFTSNEKSYDVGHLAIKGTTVCGFSEKKDFQEQKFYKHLDERLKADNYKNVNVKIFTDLGKYLDRLDQMQSLSCDESNTAGISETLKNISL